VPQISQIDTDQESKQAAERRFKTTSEFDPRVSVKSVGESDLLQRFGAYAYKLI
jgi:hypothetical protein